MDNRTERDRTSPILLISLLTLFGCDVPPGCGPCYFRHGWLARPVRRYGFRSREPDCVGVASHPLFEGGDTKRSINARQPATTQNGPLEPAQQATTLPSLPFLRRSVTDDLLMPGE